MVLSVFDTAESGHLSSAPTFMPHKVLVFESDSAFASELRNELGKLDCQTVIVDDGNIGLQQAAADRPDLILLSIELPRMNGFSVCNKLKKDVNLRDVPLIIMSSESSGETFEQHRKLRTRAEDYVHKPIAFGELLQHIRAFVPLGDPREQREAAGAGGIDIDEEVHERGHSRFPSLPAQRGTGRTSVIASNPKEIDPDIDQFADAAFGMLQSGSSPGTDLSTLATDHEEELERRATGRIDQGPPNGAPQQGMPGDEPRTMYHAQANVNPYGRHDEPPPMRAQAPSQLTTQETPSEPNPGTTGTRGAVTSETNSAEIVLTTNEEAERLRSELADAQRKGELLERELGTARTDLGRMQEDLAKVRDEAGKHQDDLGQARADLERSRQERAALERNRDESAAELRAAADASNATSATQAASASSAQEEIKKLQLELEDAHAKLATVTASAASAAAAAAAAPTGKSGAGVSSREFLDLREASNRKDKEILSLKEALSRKDKEILEARERSLALERTAGEQDDKMLALERELNQEKERVESLQADKDNAKKVGEDLKTRLTKAQGDIEAREKDIADAKERLADATATHEAALASARAEREEALEAQRKAHDEALEAAGEEAKKDRAAAVAAREQEMQKESDGKLAALHRAQQDEIARLKGDFERERQDTSQKNDAMLAAADKRRLAELAKAEEDSEAALAARVNELQAHEKGALEAAEKDHAEKISALENDRDSRIAAMEARSTRELAEVRAVAEAQKLAADEQVTELTRDLKSTREQLAATTEDRDRLRSDLEATRTELSARGGGAGHGDEQGRVAHPGAGGDQPRARRHPRAAGARVDPCRAGDLQVDLGPRLARTGEGRARGGAGADRGDR